MRAKNLAEAAMRDWESKDGIVLASLLADDFVCRSLLPQPIQKVQYPGFMQAIMTAMPDWLFDDHCLDEGPSAIF